MTSGQLRSDGKGSDQCTTCPGGHFTPHNNMSSCGQCDAGKYAAARAFECMDCKAGFFAPAAATVSCSACPAGKVAPEKSTVNCTDCNIGNGYKCVTSSFESSHDILIKFHLLAIRNCFPICVNLSILLLLQVCSNQSLVRRHVGIAPKALIALNQVQAVAVLALWGVRLTEKCQAIVTSAQRAAISQRQVPLNA